MSSDISKTFTKDNLDAYLKELAKEFRRQNGKLMPAEIILVGGAAILVNYGFREMTADIDAIIHASSAMRDAILRVGDRFGLPKPPHIRRSLHSIQGFTGHFTVS